MQLNNSKQLLIYYLYQIICIIQKGHDLCLSN